MSSMYILELNIHKMNNKYSTITSVHGSFPSKNLIILQHLIICTLKINKFNINESNK